MGEFIKHVKYNSKLNDTAFNQFNSMDLDLFFTLLTELRYEGAKDITLSYDAIREAIKFDKSKAARVFDETLKTFYSKLKNITFVYEDSSKYSEYVIFPTFKSDIDKKEVMFGINNHLRYLITDFSRYTEFQLYAHNSLKSTYAKTAFRLLNQFKGTGSLILTIDEFRRKLDIPESYKPGNIKQFVLKAIIEELSPLFKSLSITPLKRDKNDKRKVTHYFFKFSPILTISQYDKLKGIPEYPGENASIEEIIKYEDKLKRAKQGDYQVDPNHPVEIGKKIADHYEQAEGQITADDYLK